MQNYLEEYLTLSMLQVVEPDHDFHLEASLIQYDDYLHHLVEDYKNQIQLLVHLIFFHF